MNVFNEENVLSISEKLERATVNVGKVFEAGRKYELSNTYDKGYRDGKEAEYTEFWDAYQEYGNKTNYEATFAGGGWNNKTFMPKYPIRPTYAYYMFYACGVTDGWEIIKNIDFSQCSMMSNAFSRCHFVHVGEIDCTSATALTNLFSNSRNLVTVDKLIVNEQNMFFNAFNNVTTLENITFEGSIANDISFQWAPKLTKESIESIINHLSDTANSKVLTLSTIAVNEAFKVVSDAPDENGEYVYTAGSFTPIWRDLVNKKPNWAINLA